MLFYILQLLQSSCPFTNQNMHSNLRAVCRRGQVLAVTVNEQTMVPFVSQQLNNLELALALAKRGNLPGAEALVGQNFDRLFASGQFKEAAEAAAESPQVLQPPLCSPCFSSRLLLSSLAAPTECRSLMHGLSAHNITLCETPNALSFVAGSHSLHQDISNYSEQ